MLRHQPPTARRAPRRSPGLQGEGGGKDIHIGPSDGATGSPNSVSDMLNGGEQAVEKAAEQIECLRRQIDMQHEALRAEREAHASTAVGVELLCRDISALEAEFAWAETERELQQRHLSHLERAMTSRTSPLSASQQKVTSHQAHAQCAAPEPLTRHQQPVADADPDLVEEHEADGDAYAGWPGGRGGGAAAVAVDWYALAVEYSQPC